MGKESAIKIEHLEYEGVIEEAECKVCERYNSGFLKKQREAQQNDEPTLEKTYKTLAMATSFHFNPQNMEEPFDPMMVMQGSRSAIADDLSEDQLNLIEKLIENTDDPELKARLADIIWIRKRDFEKVKIAISAYLDSADHLQDNELFSAIDRLERALRLSNSLGKGATDLFDATIEKIKNFINKIEYEDSFYTLRLMELLLEFKKGDANTYTELTKEIAEKADVKNDWRRARQAWRINAKWHLELGDSNGESSSLIKAAETFVQQSEAATSKMVAASFIQKAIEAHRRIGGQQERTNELHNKLLDTQRGIKDEMGSFSTDIDLSEIVKHARESVEGKEFQEVIFSLCLLVHPLKVEELRERTQRLANKHPMQFIIPGTLVDEEGKTIAEYPNILTGSSEEKEEALIAHMNRQAHHDIQINVTGMINPARKQILLEHRLRETDLHEFVSSNSLVPPGRAYLFTKGLYDGFKGDFISATNILACATFFL